MARKALQEVITVFLDWMFSVNLRSNVAEFGSACDADVKMKIAHKNEGVAE